MKKKEIERMLRKAGFTRRRGSRHDVWVKQGYPPIPVPRHKGDIPLGTLKSIKKAANLE